MMRTVFTATGLLLVLLCVFGQSGCQQSPEANRAAPGASPKSEVVDTAAIEKELTRIENDWPRIFKDKDVDTIKRVYADDIMIIYPDGTIGSKAQDFEDVEKGNVTFDSWEIHDLKAKALGNDSAIASGRTVIKNGKTRMADGKTVESSGEYRWVDTFARREGRWRIVSSASVPVKSPVTSPSPTVRP